MNSKLKMPAANTKAYKKLLKNISLLSLDSSTNFFNSKTVNSCKNSKKNKDIGKKKNSLTNWFVII